METSGIYLSQLTFDYVDYNAPDTPKAPWKANSYTLTTYDSSQTATIPEGAKFNGIAFANL